MLSLFRSHFPSFWPQIESELSIDGEDISTVKIILSVLGYSTKASVAAINSKKCVEQLEQEFVQRKSTTKLFDHYFGEYPVLKEIGCFPSGLRAVLLQISSHLNRQLKPIENENEIIEKVLNLGQKVIRFIRPLSLFKK